MAVHQRNTAKFDQILIAITEQERHPDMIRVATGGRATGEAILQNVEFKPSYGYEKQQIFFREILGKRLSDAEREKFLEFAVSGSFCARHINSLNKRTDVSFEFDIF